MTDPTIMYMQRLTGWMDDLLFYILFNSISVISGHWEGDNERLFPMEPCLQLKRFRLEVGLKQLTVRSGGQCFIY